MTTETSGRYRFGRGGGYSPSGILTHNRGSLALLRMKGLIRRTLDLVH